MLTRASVTGLFAGLASPGCRRRLKFHSVEAIKQSAMAGWGGGALCRITVARSWPGPVGAAGLGGMT